MVWYSENRYFLCPGRCQRSRLKSVQIHGDGYLPVHAGGRVMGLAVRVLLNKLERTVLQFIQ